jgi:DNA-binding transcriptional MerR regulator
MTAMTIGRLAQATNVKVPTIRFYEQIGLMPQPDRTESDRRTYGDDAVRRLRFIRHSRQLGFDIKDIEALLGLADRPDVPCDDADQIARTHLATVEGKIAQLLRLRDELTRLVGCCGAGKVLDCRVIEGLNNHALCEDRAH